MENWSIKDEIRDYWTIRAETYDLSPGHGIAKLAEMQAWKALVTAHLGEAIDEHGSRKALDLACGTGVMTMLMHDLGFDVVGLDFTEAMMARARRKAADAGAAITFLTRDAEQTLEPDARYDVIIARHLVWTLPDPQAAFRDWLRILKPGGRLLVIDGDFVRRSWLERLMPYLERIFGKSQDGHSLLTPEQWAAHERIVAQVHFHHGVRDGDVRALFEAAGFEDLQVDDRLQHIRRARGTTGAWRKRLERMTQHRFAVSGRKPG